MTDVRPPDATDWTDALAVTAAGEAYTLTAAGALGLPLDYLTPGRAYTLTLTASATPDDAAGPVTALLDGDPRTVPATAADLTWTTTAERPVRLDVRNVAALTVHAFTIATPDVADLAHGLSLEVSVPRAGADTFRLDTSRLDRAALTAAGPWPGTMVLDEGKLDETYLYIPDLLEWWAPIAPAARLITTRRGARVDGLAPVAEAGTLAAAFPNGVDPRQLGARRGTPVRLYHWPTRRPVFTGTLTRAAVQPERPGRRLRFTTILEAVDTVGDLAATMRYGAIVGVGLSEPWRERVARLMASAPETSWRVAAAEAENTPTMANTVHESNLAAHLDIAAASARGAWWADAAGVVTLCPGRPAGEAALVLTDRPSAEAGAWPYLDALAGWDTGDLVSVVTLSNLGALHDAEQGWSADDVEVTVTNATLAATYGRHVATATVNVAADEAEAIAAAYARDQTSSARVTRVALDALADAERAASLEVMAPVVAELRGERREAFTAAVAHTVTPQRWTAHLDLWERP